MRPVAALLLLLGSAAAAQAPLRLDPAREAASLEDHLAIATDPEAARSLSALEAASFRPAASVVPDGRAVPSRYGGRVVLASAADEPTEWVVPLALDSAVATLVRADGAREVHRTGILLPREAWTAPASAPPSVRLRLGAGESATLYLQVRHDPDGYRYPVAPRPVEAAAFEAQTRRRALLQGAFLGALLALAAYTLVVFAALRDRSSLYYALFLVATALYWAAREGVAPALGGAAAGGALAHPEASFFALAVAAVAYVQFVRRFLRTGRHTPRLDRALVGVAGAWAVSAALAAAGGWGPATTLAAASGLALILTTFGAGVGAHRAGFAAARYYLLAAGSFLGVGVLYAALFFVSEAWQDALTPLLQASMLGEALLLSVALSARIRVLSAERSGALEAQARAEATSETLRDANELQTRLLGIAAHDLRSPLTTIAGFAEQLEAETPERPDVHDLTEAIQRGARRMLGLIEDLLVTAALDTQSLRLRPESVDVGRLVTDVVGEYRARAEEKGQAMTLMLPEITPFAYLDPERFRAVVDNVVSNAVKYTPRGGRVEVACTAAGGAVRIAVADTGPGLSAEDRAALFQRFKRLTPTPTGGESSTGLGLSIAQELVALHGGRIEVESAEGEGTTFTIVVPLGADVREAAGAPEAA